MANNRSFVRAERMPRPTLEPLEPRRLLATAPVGAPLLGAEPEGIESSPPAIIADSSSAAPERSVLSLTTVRESFEENGNRLEVLAEPTPVATLIEDPANPGLMILVVAGTNGDDTLSVELQPGDDQQIRVRTNDTELGLFPRPAVSRILIHGFDGNDNLSIASELTTPAEIYGGEGNDQIDGGGGRDLLLGGLGDDAINGGGGRDLLVGGLGLDALCGDDGDDILIGGHTTYDEHAIALLELLSTWEASSDCAVRIDGLGERLTADSVVDDAARDGLVGSPGIDWVLDFLFQETLPNVQTNIFSLNRVCSLYQNPLPRLSRDVNGDGRVSPLDALQVINRLNRDPFTGFPDRSLIPPPHYLDVDGNGRLNPLDALLVINDLNRRSR